MRLNLLVLIILFLLSPFVIAEENSNRGWFVGLGAGSTSYSNDDTLDDNDTSVTVFGGYRFNQYLGIQGNAVSLGKYSGDESTVLASTELSGFSVTAVGAFPVGIQGIELFGRLGFGLLKYTQNFNFLGSEVENSSTGDSIVSSLGVKYTPLNFQRMSFYIAYENYYFETKNVFNSDDSESNSVGVLAINVSYNF